MNESQPAPPPVASLLAEQRERWGRGDRVLVEAYVQRHPTLRTNPDGLLDLIYNEVFLREQHGEVPRLDEYLGRFPALAEPLRVQFAVHQAIQADPRPERESAAPTVPGLELLGEIGRGGMAVVYRAKDMATDRLVAVKLLRPEHLRKRAVRKRFLAEARIAEALDHPHIIQLHQIGEGPAGPYLVMELIEGHSLETALRRGVLDIPWAVRLLVPVAEAVHYAHGLGIIHRDLKPANIMLDREDRPRVMDFGMAKILRGAVVTGQSSTQQGTVLGTPAYMPPEQAGENHTEPGPYSDVYSLGAILYALLTGRPPFDEGALLATLIKVRSAELPRRLRLLRAEVPEGLEQVCMKCLQKRPAGRYGSALALADALRPFATDCGRRFSRSSRCLFCPQTGKTIPLNQREMVLGRSSDCDIVLKAPEVSRRHCRIECTPTDVTVEDLGSAQGTRVNGKPIRRGPLRDGDRLEIALEVFQVRLPPLG